MSPTRHRSKLIKTRQGNRETSISCEYLNIHSGHSSRRSTVTTDSSSELRLPVLWVICLGLYTSKVSSKYLRGRFRNHFFIQLVTETIRGAFEKFVHLAFISGNTYDTAMIFKCTESLNIFVSSAQKLARATCDH